MYLNKYQPPSGIVNQSRLFAPKHFEIIWLFNILTMNVPNEGYSRNAACTLN
jgi:hypothetical protein